MQSINENSLWNMHFFRHLWLLYADKNKIEYENYET